MRFNRPATGGTPRRRYTGLGTGRIRISRSKVRRARSPRTGGRVVPAITWALRSTTLLCVAALLTGSGSQFRSVEPSRSPPRASSEAQRGTLPVILAPADAARYSQIFDLQEIDGTATADKLISRLRDRSLVGHVLAERYLNAYGGPPSYDRLAAWLTKYRDLPQAERIYKLARKIRPKKRKRPSPPAAKHGSVGAEKVAPPPHWSKKNLTRKQRRRVSQLKRRARIYLSRGWVSRAEKMLSDPEVRRLFDRFEHDEARAQVAAAWFYFGEDKRAYKLAIVALARSGDKLPIAYWTAGLAAWRLQLYAQSASHFEALAAAQDDTGWIVSGGANWGRACPSQIRSIPRGNEVADGGRSPSPQALRVAGQARTWFGTGTRIPTHAAFPGRDRPIAFNQPRTSGICAHTGESTSSGRNRVAGAEELAKAGHG